MHKKKRKSHKMKTEKREGHRQRLRVRGEKRAREREREGKRKRGGRGESKRRFPSGHDPSSHAPPRWTAAITAANHWPRGVDEGGRGRERGVMGKR